MWLRWLPPSLAWHGLEEGWRGGYHFPVGDRENMPEGHQLEILPAKPSQAGDHFNFGGGVGVSG